MWWMMWKSGLGRHIWMRRRNREKKHLIENDDDDSSILSYPFSFRMREIKIKYYVERVVRSMYFHLRMMCKFSFSEKFLLNRGRTNT